MASIEFKNNTRSTVSDNPLAAGAITLNVATGEGANFPSSFPFLITVWDAITYPNPGDDSGMEIVKCTGRSTDALTIVRAQESTADVEHILGERVAMLITAGHFNDATTGIVTKLDAIQIGGLYGINVETLTGDKTLTGLTDEIYQFLDANGANRIITLDTVYASAGDRWVIRNTAAYNSVYYLQIKQGSTELDKGYSGSIKQFIFDGSNWKFVENGTGDDTGDDANLTIGAINSALNTSIAIGSSVVSNHRSVVIGHVATGPTNGDGVVIGNGTSCSPGTGSVVIVGKGGSVVGNHSVALGYNAKAADGGVAIGSSSDNNAKAFSVALGRETKNERYSEIAHNISNQPDQENNITIGGWERTTADATPVEIWCGGTTSQRFTVRASSVLAFRLIITARDNVAGHVGMWTVTNGVIKRDGSNNTAMAIAATVTEVVNESGDWSVAVTADDTNEALIITVTGDATNTVQWVARLDGVETHF